jgi:hypothetical protein
MEFHIGKICHKTMVLKVGFKAPAAKSQIYVASDPDQLNQERLKITKKIEANS